MVTLERGIEGYAVPSKFYSILASGKAILAILGKKCEMAELIQKYECGFVVPQGDLHQIIKIVSQCHHDPEKTKQMGKNARLCFEKNFTRELATKTYQTLIESLYHA